MCQNCCGSATAVSEGVLGTAEGMLLIDPGQGLASIEDRENFVGLLPLWQRLSFFLSHLFFPHHVFLLIDSSFLRISLSRWMLVAIFRVHRSDRQPLIVPLLQSASATGPRKILETVAARGLDCNLRVLAGPVPAVLPVLELKLS